MATMIFSFRLHSSHSTTSAPAPSTSCAGWL